MEKYTIAIVKPNHILPDSWDKNILEVKSEIDILWEGICEETEARQRFKDAIIKQSTERKETGAPWRKLMLYNESGTQIQQES